MSSKFDIKVLAGEQKVIAALADLLVETVASGGSIGFMYPVTLQTATVFWINALAAAGRGERVVLGAYDGDRLVGTVTLLLDCPPNQPHRAEIAKMMTGLRHRGQGIARSLMEVAEQMAVDRGRTLLNLDTAEDEGAAGLYEKMGFQRTGVIPDYALKPHGGLTGTIIYWKRIGK